MDNLSTYWDSIPTGIENAVTYDDLNQMWETGQRKTRQILHKLSLYDSGDDYILIRSSKQKGFYRSDDKETIKAYKAECLARGKNVFALVKKINRVLNENGTQYSFTNNLRVCRESAGLNQGEVCDKLRIAGLDKFLLSKMENNICLPTSHQLELLAALYGCTTRDLIMDGEFIPDN